MNNSKDKNGKKVERVVNTIKNYLKNDSTIPFEIIFPENKSVCFGAGEPSFSVKILDEKGLSAFCSFDQVKFCEAYIDGNINIEGSMFQLMSIRRLFNDAHPLYVLSQKILPFLIGQVKADRKAISEHYEYEDDFYLTFLDKTRCYSQAIYKDDNEALEKAQRRKLDFIIDACELKKGDRVLDVGGGWGVFSEYGGVRGIKVTSLTISNQSEQFIQNLIKKLKIPCEVSFANFYEYQNEEPYDAIVILGVMEHLANYPAVIQKLYSLVKPGGMIYLDASSAREKYSKPTFLSQYIFPGNHSYFCLHEFLKHVAKSVFEIKNVFNDRYSYYLTCKQWAKNLEKARTEIVSRWEEKLFRMFQLYLWGSAESFFHGTLDAYRIVLRRTI